MIVVGILRWFFNLQRDEIQLLFAARGTRVSTGELSNLSTEFLIRFYALHRRHIPRIKALLRPREIPSGYPFLLPYFEIMNRVLEITGLIKRIVRWNAKHNLAVLAVLDLSEKLTELTAAHAKEVKELLEKSLAGVEIEGREIGGDPQAAAEKIVGEFRGHWDELIVEVKDKSGNALKIVRHKGIEELGHRWSRMHTRRRTGRSRTTKEMVKYGALLPCYRTWKMRHM